MPVGYKGNASRYAVILDGDPPKLVARTWFAKQDLIYYLDNHVSSEVLEILDLKEAVRLRRKSAQRFEPMGAMSD